MERTKEKAKQCPPESGEERTLRARKTAESILLFTREVGDTSGQQQEIKRKMQRCREKDRLREEKERTRRQHHWFCQTMKYYKIFYSQYSQGTRAQHKLVSEILSKMPCAFNCGGLNSDFAVRKLDYLRSAGQKWANKEKRRVGGGGLERFLGKQENKSAFAPSEQAHVVLKARS